MNNLGVARLASGVKLPKESANIHCAGCWLYEDRLAISEAYDLGVWDFVTCYGNGCIKKDKKREDYDRIKSREYYRRIKKTKCGVVHG